MINLKIDPEFQSQIPPLTDDEFKQLEENILKEGKLISPLIVWGNTLVDGHNRYAILQKHPEIYFSTMPLRFANREEALAWICKNQLGRRNLTPEQKKFLIGKQYSVEHRKPGGNGNNQHTAAAKKTAPEELCQFDTIPPTIERNRAFPTGNALLYISLSYVDFCRVRPIQGRTLFFAMLHHFPRAASGILRQHGSGSDAAHPDIVPAFCAGMPYKHARRQCHFPAYCPILSA